MTVKYDKFEVLISHARFLIYTVMYDTHATHKKRISRNIIQVCLY